MLRTERLLLLPLSYEQLQKYIRTDHSLEAELGLKNSLHTLSPALKEALETTILPNVADSNKNYLYSTLWTLLFEAEQCMVGDLCIVGEPNELGEIEIGYGTYPQFRQQGFMTEAVGGLIKWAKEQPGVKAIIADTEKWNVASFAVLEKNSFVKVGENETCFHWQLKF